MVLLQGSHTDSKREQNQMPVSSQENSNMVTLGAWCATVPQTTKTCTLSCMKVLYESLEVFVNSTCTCDYLFDVLASLNSQSNVI